MRLADLASLPPGGSAHRHAFSGCFPGGRRWGTAPFWGPVPATQLAAAAYHCLFLALLVAAALIDAELWIIPDEITIAGMVSGIALATICPQARPLPADASGHWAAFWIGVLGLVVGSGLTSRICARPFTAAVTVPPRVKHRRSSSSRRRISDFAVWRTMRPRRGGLDIEELQALAVEIDGGMLALGPLGLDKHSSSPRSRLPCARPLTDGSRRGCAARRRRPRDRKA